MKTTTFSLLMCVAGLHFSGTAQNFAKQDEKSGLYGIANADDQYIVKPVYKEVDFNFGYKPGSLYLVKNKSDKYGFINDAGKEIVACKYDDAMSFEQGYSVVKVKTGEYTDLEGLVDSTGKEVIPMKYGKLEYYANEQLVVFGETSTSSVGVMTVTGKQLIAPQYEFWSKRITSGLWPVGKNDICGVVNMKNEIVVPFSYQMIESYSDELKVAPAKKDDKFGFIDQTGKVVIPFMYEDGWPSGSFLAVKKNGKWGLVDVNNKIILPIEYAAISSAGKATAWVSKTENESPYEIDLATKQKIENK